MPSPDVTLVSLYPTDDGGSSGVASYTAHLAHALYRAGAEVTVVAQQEPGHAGVRNDGGVRVERSFCRGPWALSSATRAASRTRAPVVHLQHELFLFGGPASIPGLVPALGRLRRQGRGPVVTMHQVVSPSSVDRDFVALHRVPVPPVLARIGIGSVQAAVAGIAARTIVHESAFAEVVRGAVVVPHGVGSEGPCGAVPAQIQDRARQTLGVDNRALLVLCFGFVAPYKGLELVLEAARLAGPGVQLVVAGAEHPRLAGQGYLSGLREHWGEVARFTGWVPDSEVPAWFEAADVALLPYPQPFSSSGVLALALAHGTPLLLSEALAACIGAPAELSTALDAVSLAARMSDLAADPAGLGRLGERTRSLNRHRSWAEVAARHIELYGEVTRADRLVMQPVLSG